MNKNFRKLVLTSMFAALICTATMVIQVPSPLGGYVNLGDCFILVGAWILGPVYGFAAGGIGSALADIVIGYPHYAPGTLIIKGLMAVAAALITRKLISGKSEHRTPAYAAGAIAAEIVMIVGYAAYDGFVFGTGFMAALSGVGNLIQGAVGAVAGTSLIRALSAAGITAKAHGYTESFRHNKY